MPGGHPAAPGRRLAEGALLGACVTGGWLLNDFVRFFTSGQPSVFLALVPGSLVALGVGTLLGALAGRLALFWALYLAAGLVAFLSPQKTFEVIGPVFGFDTDRSAALIVLFQGKTLLIWTLAWLLARGAQRLGWPAARAATCLGVLGASALAFVKRGDGLPYEVAPFWQVPVGAALAVLLLGWPRLRHRRVATAAVVLVAALLTAKRGLPPTRVSYWRDDLPPPTVPAGEAPNLLLIVLDTVRAQSLAPYGHTRVTTPELDQWVREQATIFGQARSTSSFTLASHASLFTGMLPAEHQAARPRPSSQPLAAEFPTLAERLRERGYQTGAIISNRTYLSPQFGMDRGFEHFDHRDGSLVENYLALAQLTGRTIWAGHLPYRDAHTITGAAVDWLGQRRTGDPFFLMLNYLDAHVPYLPRAPHDMQFEDVRLVNPLRVPSEHLELAYDRGLHYLDSQVARLLRACEEQGLLENTLIVITSDHGEAFGEHGLLEHCWMLYDEVVRVPLYIKPAGGRRAERDERLINSADLMWLMLDELGVPYQRAPASGAPHAEWYRQVPLGEDYLALAQETHLDLDRDLVAWIEDGRKIVVSTRRVVEAYDLASDPGELRPLELSQEEIDAAVARALTWWEAHPLAAEQTEVIPPDELARLRALGYAGGE